MKDFPQLTEVEHHKETGDYKPTVWAILSSPRDRIALFVFKAINQTKGT